MFDVVAVDIASIVPVNASAVAILACAVYFVAPNIVAYFSCAVVFAPPLGAFASAVVATVAIAAYSADAKMLSESDVVYR